MDFIKMIMELPGEKRSQDVVEHTEWNSLWKLIVTQGNHSENYLEQLYDYFFNKEEGWVHKVQAELDGVQPYVEGAMTQPVGKAPDGSLWTYPSTESGTVPWGNVMGDITKQQDLIQKFNAKSDVGHGHDISTLTFNEGDIDSSWINYSSPSVPTSALENLSVTTEKLNNGAVTTAKIASSAVINDSIANGSVSGAKLANGSVTAPKIASGAVTRAKLAQDALYSPIVGGVDTRYITVSDIGKTLKGVWNAAMTLTITQENSANIPEGAEFAVLRWGTSGGNDCKIIADGTRLIFTGEDTLHKNGIAKISDAFGMIALKKISSDPTQGDSWLVTGNAEVVS